MITNFLIHRMDCSLAQVVDRLKRNDPTLTFLDLRNDSVGNTVGSDGAALLADALKSNNVLTNLNLGAVGIGSEGAAPLA